jgi:hypothetical protein
MWVTRSTRWWGGVAIAVEHRPVGEQLEVGDRELHAPNLPEQVFERKPQPLLMVAP